MIKVSVKVGGDSTHFSVTVRAESIRRAVGIVEALYPGGDVRVVHPIDSEGFFVKEPTATAGLGELEMPKSVASSFGKGHNRSEKQHRY